MHNVEFAAELTITQVALTNRAIKEFNLHIRDITQQIKQQKKMTRLAFNDSLTGLYNRSYFINKLQQEIDFSARHRTTLTLMFLDLDQFKCINDNLGHKAGDEFIILFPDMVHQAVMSQKVDGILAKIREPYYYQGKELAIRTSGRYAISKSGDIQPEQLVQRADMALYAAKKGGRNNYCFFKIEMEEQINKRFYYEGELRTALEKNQFFMVYQPKVDCRTNAIQGLEALIRWNHPQQGLISPAIFIPILEESSFMEEVSLWILETVCKQIAVWNEQQLLSFYIAVNLSGRDFLVDNLDKKIKK